MEYGYRFAKSICTFQMAMISFGTAKTVKEPYELDRNNLNFIQV